MEIKRINSRHLEPLLALALFAPLSGCGDDGKSSGDSASPTTGAGDGDGDGDGSGDGDGDGDGSGSGSGDGDGDSDSSGGGDGDGDSSGDGDGDGDTGTNFVVEPDGGGTGVECDLWSQDCPEGQKCMPWANDGGNSWNATKCSPVSASPKQPGDECTVEGSGVAGVDDCDVGGMCWDVDGETGMGTCVAMCTGTADAPMCEDPATHCTITNDGVLILCLAGCDPVLQDCPDGSGCYTPDGLVFECVPDASGEAGAYGDACEFGNACDPGLFCADATVVPGCTTASCCSEFCDINSTDGDAQCMGQADGQMCNAVFEEGSAPPGWEHVGMCGLPT